MKICIATTSRSDFGLIKNLIFELKKNNFKVKVIAGGSHYLKKFGKTFSEIRDSGIKINKKIYSKINSKSPINVSYILSTHIISAVKIFKDLNPDLLIVLGDRYEMFGIAIAAHISGVPIAHIHGGETTLGTVDDAFRHSITKMSQIHFAANKIYRNRIIQLGESPKNVFSVGGLGVDSINKIKFLSRNDLEEKLKIKFNRKNLIISFHPETLKINLVERQMKKLLKALSTLKDTTLIFTSPGLDLKNEIIIKKIKIFIKKNENAYYFSSLGQISYFSILNVVDAIVGNSSSGILEMPTFKKPTINIGDRQSGRLKSITVIDCEIETKKIINSLKKIYSKQFMQKIKNSTSPYGSFGASVRIVKVLKKINLKNIIVKKFYDII